ncbi:ARM repeat superfamily protein [Pelomyxa schiedti]|nr:ARM repeat superfamily protein [Pelomyxa schiedti]
MRLRRRESSRFEYLRSLVTEFQDTNKIDCKLQIVANLANFAFDPQNYHWFRELHIIDLFLDMLTEPEEQLIEFGAGGLCNLCCDNANLAVIEESEGIPLITGLLESSNETILMYALTILYYITNRSPATKISKLCTPTLIEKVYSSEYLPLPLPTQPCQVPVPPVPPSQLTTTQQTPTQSPQEKSVKSSWLGSENMKYVKEYMTDLNSDQGTPIPYYHQGILYDKQTDILN